MSMVVLVSLVAAYLYSNATVNGKSTALLIISLIVATMWDLRATR